MLLNVIYWSVYNKINLRVVYIRLGICKIMLDYRVWSLHVNVITYCILNERVKHKQESKSARQQ